MKGAIVLSLILSTAVPSHSFQVGLRAPSARSHSGFSTSSSALFINSESTSTHHWIPDEVPDHGDNESSARGISSSELRNMSEARRRRLKEEEDLETRFLTGDALHQLRQSVLGLRYDLQEARRLKQKDRVRQLESSILRAQQVDAEFVYNVSCERMEAAQQAGLTEEAARYRLEAQRARKALPQFNLDGLWVGRYGDQGFEMINVTYVEDTLVAYKVTGDRNVPMGQVSFTVDLSSKHPDSMLEPIELASDAADQWGSRYLQRFSGKGQVASPGYKNSKWLDGQLILVNQYFSFAWLPIEHQVFFGRPSAELTLKLLKESRAKQFADGMAREHLARCMEETKMLEEEMQSGIFQSHEQSWYYEQEGFFE